MIFLSFLSRLRQASRPKTVQRYILYFKYTNFYPILPMPHAKSQLFIFGFAKSELSVAIHFYHQLAEQGIGPGEPRAGELAVIIALEGLVHKARAGMSL